MVNALKSETREEIVDSIGLVILAGGEGKRLKLNVPKPLAPIRSKKLIDFPLRVCFDFLGDKNGIVSVVVGHRREEVESHVKSLFPNTIFAIQKEQKGTADALKSYFNDVQSASKQKYTAVICADTPMLTVEEVEVLYKNLITRNLDAVAATFQVENPKGYGRIVRGSKGFSIVEEKDATPEQKFINEVNSGLYFFKTEYILKHINQIDSKNASSEFYLTDLFKSDRNVEAILFQDSFKFFGVNDLVQLGDMEKKMNKEKIKRLIENGVYFIDRSQVYIEEDVNVAPGVTIYPNVFLHGKTEIQSGCIIEVGSVIKDSILSKSVHIKAYSYIEKAKIDDDATIGPFAHLRPDSQIGTKSKIGNFVETKNVILHKGVKVSHLSYVGDAEVGDDSNLGCGFITCNYDGAKKHKTKIGKGCFIGSDSQMIAPLTIGDECYVASGSTINQDMPSGSFAIARERQVTKEGMARRFIKTKESSK
ncbi:MAG: bifunctional UDP-N-acetylglucosamine diphosphorylase/glucosamine-1-phosphate N-acetyltransferase GlmU [Bdellovibrio sp.]